MTSPTADAGGGNGGEGGVSTSAPLHRCSCGAALPDKRATYCDACRGARAKAQDLARKQEALDALKDVDWNYVGLAVRMKLEEIRANDRRVDQLVQEIAVAQAECPASVLPSAVRGNVLRPENFKRICRWLGRAPGDFKQSPANRRRGGEDRR